MRILQHNEFFMKNKLNITIDKSLIIKMRQFAARNNTSVSGLVEEYFKKLVSRPSPKKENFLEIIARLPKPDANFEQVSVEDYYKKREKKYGF